MAVGARPRGSPPSTRYTLANDQLSKARMCASEVRSASSSVSASLAQAATS